MVHIKCPKCSTVNHSEMRDWPRCQQCHEYLLKCRYCKFIDKRTWDCTHPRYQSVYASQDGGRALMDPDALINCSLHQSTILVSATEAAKKPLSPLMRMGGVALISLLILVGFVLRSSMTRPAGKTGIEMEVFCPPMTEAGIPTVIRIVIRNYEATESGPLRLRISNAFFNTFELQSLIPEPQDMSMEGVGRYLHYGGIPPKSEMLVQMTCVARRMGHATLNVSLISRGHITTVGQKQKIDIF